MAALMPRGSVFCTPEPAPCDKGAISSKGSLFAGKSLWLFLFWKKNYCWEWHSCKKLKKKKGKLQNPQTLLPVTFYLLQNHWFCFILCCFSFAPAHCTFLMLYKNSKLLPASPLGNSFCISLIYIWPNAGGSSNFTQLCAAWCYLFPCQEILWYPT